jgi:hypothetical protein
MAIDHVLKDCRSTAPLLTESRRSARVSFFRCDGIGRTYQRGFITVPYLWEAADAELECNTNILVEIERILAADEQRGSPEPLIEISTTLQRFPTDRSIGRSPPSAICQSPDIALNDLLIILLTYLWSRTRSIFSCPHPFCNQVKDLTEKHIHTAMGEGEVCGSHAYGKMFSTSTNLKHHFSQKHPAEACKTWTTPGVPHIQTTESKE